MFKYNLSLTPDDLKASSYREDGTVIEQGLFNQPLTSVMKLQKVCSFLIITRTLTYCLFIQFLFMNVYLSVRISGIRAFAYLRSSAWSCDTPLLFSFRQQISMDACFYVFYDFHQPRTLFVRSLAYDRIYFPEHLLSTFWSHT